MTGNEPILVTGAAGQLGAVGRTVTHLLLDRGLPSAPGPPEKPLELSRITRGSRPGAYRTRWPTQPLLQLPRSELSLNVFTPRVPERDRLSPTAVVATIALARSSGEGERCQDDRRRRRWRRGRTS